MMQAQPQNFYFPVDEHGVVNLPAGNFKANMIHLDPGLEITGYYTAPVRIADSSGDLLNREVIQANARTVEVVDGALYAIDFLIALTVGMILYLVLERFTR